MEMPAGVEVSALRIVKYPDPVLMKPCAEATEVDDDLRQLAEAMFEVMRSADGVGLAAPQVGVPVRMFVVNTAVEGVDHGGVYINPQFIQRDGSAVAEEGCLSVPGVNCRVKRWAKVTLVATGLDGQEFTEEVTDLAARAFQHEMDHLDGTLISDRMSSVAKLANRKAMKELREAYAEGHGG